MTNTNNVTIAPIHGMVKWFDHKKGYGFITVVDGSEEYQGKDVFVHYTDISVRSSTNKNLYQGEYVSFHLTNTENDTHPVKATDVMGAFRGPLRVDTSVARARPGGPRRDGGGRRRIGGRRQQGGGRDQDEERRRGGRRRQQGGGRRREQSRPTQNTQIDTQSGNDEGDDFERDGDLGSY